jgi:hypothetical protein
MAANQTLVLDSLAYDPDTGSMPDNQVTWLSSLDGALGQGSQLSVSGLSVGVHTITLQADDGLGGVATDTVTVTVVADFSLLPPPPDLLAVEPGKVLFSPNGGVASMPIAVENQNAANPISWQASADRPWIQLGAAQGTTPAILTVGADPTGLAAGNHTGTITFTSPNLPGQSVSVPVSAYIPRSTVFLPLVSR